MPRLLANGIHLHCKVNGGGPALVFIHGLGSSAEDWEPQVREFSKAYQVVTLDLRGHGQSDKPPGPYGIPLFAADTAELMKTLGIAAAHVVGLSLGGCVALQLALDHPARVRSLVLVNSAPEFIPRSFKIQLEVWRRTAIVRWRGLRPMAERLSRRLLPQPEHAGLRAAFVERFAQNDPRAYLNSLKALIGWSVTDRLGSIRCPVLVVASERDYSPVAAKEKYVRQIPDSRLVVMSAAHHAVPVEQPERFNAALAGFLAAGAGSRHGAPPPPGQPRT